MFVNIIICNSCKLLNDSDEKSLQSHERRSQDTIPAPKMSDDEDYEYEYGSDADYGDYGSDQDQGEVGCGKDAIIEIENCYYGKMSRLDESLS